MTMVHGLVDRLRMPVLSYVVTTVPLLAIWSPEDWVVSHSGIFRLTGNADKPLAWAFTVLFFLINGASARYQARWWWVLLVPVDLAWILLGYPIRIVHAP